MWREIGIGLLTAASAGVLYYGGYDHARSNWRAKVEDARADAAAAYAKRLETAARASQAAGEAHEVEVERIRTVYRTITKEIPVYVTPEVDRAYPMPNSLIRLHDASALGRPVGPAPAAEPDDSPSRAQASDLASAFTDNYGACREAMTTLSDLQAFVRSQPGY